MRQGWAPLLPWVIGKGPPADPPCKGMHPPVVWLWVVSPVVGFPPLPPCGVVVGASVGVMAAQISKMNAHLCMLQTRAYLYAHD